MNIVKVFPKDNCILNIKTEDGQTGLYDVIPYSESEAFAPLKNRSKFERVHNGKYVIEWGCGADLSAATIQTLWKLNQVNAQHDPPADTA